MKDAARRFLGAESRATPDPWRRTHVSLWQSLLAGGGVEPMGYVWQLENWDTSGSGVTPMKPHAPSHSAHTTTDVCSLVRGAGGIVHIACVLSLTMKPDRAWVLWGPGTSVTQHTMCTTRRHVRTSMLTGPWPSRSSWYVSLAFASCVPFRGTRYVR
jgi:hypothetical protein